MNSEKLELILNKTSRHMTPTTPRKRRMYKIRYQLKKRGYEVRYRQRTIILRGGVMGTKEKIWINELITKFDHLVSEQLFNN